MEHLVADAFRACHFHVTINAGAAAPRQTDVYASLGDDFLVETKWRSRRADVSDVDDLYIRLEETQPAVIGVLVSVAGFTSGALDRVQARRTRPILLVSGSEIEEVFAVPEDLAVLLRRKLNALRIHGRVLLDEAAEPDRIAPHAPGPPRLPKSDVSIVRPDGTPWDVAGPGGFSSLVFAGELADIDWVPAPGLGATFDIPVLACDENDLVNLLGILHARGWGTTRARWAIHQSGISWHGCGPAELIDALVNWEARYAAFGGGMHHTEEVVLYDIVREGAYTLAVDIAADEHRRVRHCNLSFHLPGIPTDSTPLRDLAHQLGVDHHLHFRTMNRPAVETGRYKQADSPRLAPVGLVVDSSGIGPDPRIVIGIVAETPYPQFDGIPDWWPSAGSSPGLLVCSVRSHHPLAQPRSAYNLLAVEWTWTTGVLVLRPIVDWAWEDTQGGRPTWELVDPR